MKKPFASIEQALTRRRAPQRAETPMSEAPAGAAEPENPDEFNRLVEGLAELLRADELPEGFDLKTASEDSAFAALLLELPAEAAVRVYLAEQRAENAEKSVRERVTGEIRSRGALPRSTRAGGAAGPSVDYRNMSSEDFRKLERALRQASMNGEHPTL